MDPYSAMMGDIDHMRNVLYENQRLMQNALAERDRACTERDQAIKDLIRACTERDHAKHDSSRLREQIQGLQQQFKDAEEKFAVEIAQLQHKIDYLTEQVEAKRALWMDYHPNSTVKSSKARDPFMATPSHETPTKGGSRYGSSSQRALPPAFDLHSHLSNMELSPAPTLPTRTMSSMPYGRAQPAQHVPYNKTHISTHDGSKEHGDAPLGSFSTSLSMSSSLSTTAMVPFKSNEQATLDLIDDIDKFLGMIFGWVRTYSGMVNPIEADQLAQDDKLLWSFMTNCVNPFTGKNASHRVIRLLRNEEDRPWFVMRMLVEYIRNRMWQWRAWNGFDAELTMELSDIADKLEVKGLSSMERACIISGRTLAVQKIVDSEGYTAFRQTMINQHAKKLRDCMGPLLNMETIRADAGKDLTAIATKAFDLSAKMFTSGWTLIITMPDCGTKFISSSMKPRNSEQDPTAMQIEKRKIKLAITPFITMRDDRGISIKTRTIHQASVLVEEN